MLASLGYAVAYAAVGLVILAVGYYVLDVLTPGRLSSVIWEDRSTSAAIVASSGIVSLGGIVFTSIWTNASSGFGSALGWTVAFGIVGVLMQMIAFVLLDLVTPGKLGDAVCAPGFHPASLVAGAMQVAVALIVVASIA
ncbi:MAG: hypothetical protein QOH99_1156 [Frankiaceae bacterium]|jgi:uncharacterized membrane protein YjfL (UPF0719 family)|nr:hypothetical protein [Frankiaceae bacterium]